MAGETKETIIGGIVLAGLILGILLLNAYRDLAGEAASGDYSLRATFNRVDGLLEGGEVRLGGIRIGAVDGQSLDPDYRAVVTLRIDGDVKLPADTSAAIHTDGLFGDKYVVIEPGGEEDLLEAGDEITYTQDALVIGDLLELIIARGKLKQKKLKEQAGKGGD